MANDPNQKTNQPGQSGQHSSDPSHQKDKKNEDVSQKRPTQGGTEIDDQEQEDNRQRRA